ncbi:hypothetical protein I7I49_19170 [Sinorhizobium meliloti]|uniref:hypothetical protein n=1 Tax=Rhizobium meliloti TaxID=382 RepID=UPI00237F72FC|nr:hypothetical protein [Sinorhizobium meliloti]MDE3812370.1 hypothetical protein [Sinorhizobium meliloti]
MAESVFGGLPLQSKKKILIDQAGNFIGIREKNTKNMRSRHFGDVKKIRVNFLVFHQEFLDKLGFAIFMPQRLTVLIDGRGSNVLPSTLR